MAITVNFDGSCGPINPGGRAGIGFVIYKDDVLLHSCNCEAGIPPATSNNLAEHAALYYALEWLLENGYQDEKITVFGDSMLVINQIFKPKAWKIKNGLYKEYAWQNKLIKSRFSSIVGKWIPRQENVVADALSTLR